MIATSTSPQQTPTPVQRYTQNIVDASAYADDAINVLESGPSDFGDTESWNEAVGEAISSAAAQGSSAVELLASLSPRPANAKDVVRGVRELSSAEKTFGKLEGDEPDVRPVVTHLEKAVQLFS